MIEKIYNNTNNKICFVFTKYHIYSYIHYFIETSSDLEILNLYLKNYYDDNKKFFFQDFIKKMRNSELILESVDKMMTNKEVIYEEEFEAYVKGKTICDSFYFESLYLNQNNMSIVPPINIL